MEKTSLEWLEWLSHSQFFCIKHQFNGKEQRIGHRHLPVDGWCAETKTIYKFHGCFFSRLPMPRGAHQYRQREVDGRSSVGHQQEYYLFKTLRGGN